MKLADVKGKVDFGIVTIREDEFAAVLERFPPSDRVSGQREYNLCRVDLPGGDSYLVAALRCIEQGNGEAQDAARDMLEDLAPGWLLVVGIAGGVPSDEFTLGDVVVSTRIQDFTVEAVLQDRPSEYAIAGGSIDKRAAVVVANLPARSADLAGWNSSGSIGTERPPIVVADDALYGSPDWREKAGRVLAHHATRTEPRVTTGAIASSDRLIKDTELLTVWLKVARQVLAVEMESAGVYRAAHGRRVPALAIRAISDIVGFKRDARWTAYACQAAASFASAFVRARPVEPLSTARQPAMEDDDDKRSTRDGTTAQQTPTQAIQNNGPVGHQIINQGPMTIHLTPPIKDR